MSISDSPFFIPAIREATTMISSQEAAPRETLKVPEVAAMLGISTGKAYRLVRDGEIPSLKIGHRYVILRQAFMYWAIEQHGLDPRAVAESEMRGRA